MPETDTGQGAGPGSLVLIGRKNLGKESDGEYAVGGSLKAVRSFSQSSQSQGVTDWTDWRGILVEKAVEAARTWWIDYAVQAKYALHGAVVYRDTQRRRSDVAL